MTKNLEKLDIKINEEFKTCAIQIHAINNMFANDISINMYGSSIDLLTSLLIAMEQILIKNNIPKTKAQGVIDKITSDINNLICNCNDTNN